MDEAMGRVGVSVEDIRPKSYETFRKEFWFESPDSVARRFREHQEAVCRNMELVRLELSTERGPRTPCPPEALLEVVDAPQRRRARQREEERAQRAAARKVEADRIAAEAADKQRAAIAAENHRQFLIDDLLAEMNAERASQRAARDEAVNEKIRKVLARPPPPPVPDKTRSECALPAASPRARLIDARLARAALRREEADEARRAAFVARLSAEEKREYEYAVLQAIQQERRDNDAAQRLLRYKEVGQRAIEEDTRNVCQLSQRTELSASRGREQLASHAERRRSTMIEYSQARAMCMDNAAAFRAAKAKSQFERMVAKDAAEKARLAAFMAESEAQRAQRAEERERKFRKKEVVLQQRKRGDEFRARQLLAELAARQETAATRRQVLQEAPYV